VIFTIGHSTRSRDDFLSLLKGHGVQAIADVRRFPASRRHPHFNGSEMTNWLGAEDIAYEHFPDLGGRRAPCADSINTGLRNASFRGYADYMQTPEFQRALQKLIAWSNLRPTAVMCAEAVYWQCHRALVADALAARGIGVRHILDAGPPRPHKIHERAQIRGERVCYPGLL
jgi:uncharacterized protein (DUF488 family)